MRIIDVEVNRENAIVPFLFLLVTHNSSHRYVVHRKDTSFEYVHNPLSTELFLMFLTGCLSINTPL